MGTLTVAEQIEQVKALLVKHAIIAETASWMPSLSPYERRGLRWTLADAVQTLLPERIVCFDMECVSAYAGYTLVIERFARATRGEWQPRDIAWTLNRRGTQVEVTFRSGREQVRWHFPQNRDWVSPEFLGRLGGFLSVHLTGMFVHVPCWGQACMAVYLPRRVGQELETFFRSLPEPGPQDGVVL